MTVKDEMADDDLLERLLKQFREANDQTQEERDAAERDRDYYDGKQWTAEEIAALERRGQPVITSNRIKPKIDSLLGFEKRGRTDPKAYPRTPKHDKDAEAATDALRFVCDKNRFTAIKSEAAENLFVEGIGACTVTVVPKGDYDIKITPVPWDRYYRDPHSRKRCFSDAKYQGVVLWKDEDEVLEQFPGSEEIIEGAYAQGDTELTDTYDDRPRFMWADVKRKRIRVLQHYWLEKGEWRTAILCRGGFLRKPQVSPYKDEDGKPECPLIPVSAFVDRENRRYGVVRQMISAQDEINKRRSKALHRLTMRQVVAEDGAVENVAAAKAELAKPDGFIKVSPESRFEILDGSIALQGELELLREAKAEIDTSGVDPSLQGPGNAPSGRAQEVGQAAALAEQAVVFDALKDWSWRVYRAIWCRVRQYWTAEKWIRVTDDEQNLKWVAINKPVTRGEQVLQQMQQAGQPVTPEVMARLQADPMMQEVVATENSVSDLDVDIIVDDGPDTVTVQSEQFEALVQLKQADPTAIPTKMVIMASSLRNKDQILEHLETNGVPPEMQKAMQEAQKQMQEMAQKLQEAEAKLQDKGLEAEKVKIDAYKAETERMKVVSDAQNQRLQAQMPQQPAPQF